MSTEFKLYNVDDEDLYRNKSPKEKFEIRKQMVVMAKKKINVIMKLLSTHMVRMD
jgi:hypothetical protein